MLDDPNTSQILPVEFSERTISAVSHDFRSSARQIKSFTQLLEAHLGDGIDAEAKEYLVALGSAADVLQSKLEALDRFSANTTKPMRLKEWDPNEIVDGAAVSIANELEQVGAVLVVDRSSASEAKVVVDREHLETVFVELLRNSLMFCESPAQINIGWEKIDGAIVVSVTDSGPGFQAQNNDRAFDLFRRFHLQDYPGTGTGLAIVRRILERHGTLATIQSDPVGGTTVQFTLQEHAA